MILNALVERLKGQSNRDFKGRYYEAGLTLQWQFSVYPTWRAACQSTCMTLLGRRAHDRQRSPSLHMPLGRAYQRHQLWQLREADPGLFLEAMHPPRLELHRYRAVDAPMCRRRVEG